MRIMPLMSVHVNAMYLFTPDELANLADIYLDAKEHEANAMFASNFLTAILRKLEDNSVFSMPFDQLIPIEMLFPSIMVGDETNISDGLWGKATDTLLQLLQDFLYTTDSFVGLSNIDYPSDHEYLRLLGEAGIKNMFMMRPSPAVQKAESGKYLWDTLANSRKQLQKYDETDRTWYKGFMLITPARSFSHLFTEE